MEKQASLEDVLDVLQNVHQASIVLFTEMKRVREIENSYYLWQEKTSWINERKDWPFDVAGKHRADVMKELIDYYEDLLENEAQ